MATPSRTPATSTPKTANLTPNSVRKMASPRPVTAGKQPFAHKSPMAAMKTPASAHSHNLSTSSQPSHTPLLAHSFTEGAVNLDSPSAALMGFSHSHGLTPLPSGLDGLGLQSISPRHTADTEPRSVEKDKAQRLQDVLSLLKARVSGYGVTREGVVRVAQMSGFKTYWDEDLLTVAGNCVDLEIVFDSIHKNSVKDVVLKISAAGSEERQEEASEILKKNLAQQPDGTGQIPWNKLDGFVANIGRLRQLDKLSEGLNCFEAVDGLYGAFQQIWVEEKKRLTWTSELHHLCRGSVGRARMNKRGELGVAVEYWVSRHELANDQSRLEDAEAPTSDAATTPQVSGSQHIPWTTQISCEAGFPSLTMSKEWLAPEILTLDESEEMQANEAESLKPSWKKQGLFGETTADPKDENDPMKIDGDMSLGTTNIHFTFNLDPVLYLPLGVVDSLMGRGLMLTTDRSKITQYKQVLDPKLSSRWLKHFNTYNSDGVKKKCNHSYQLSGTSLDCYPVSTVGFTHPSQLTSLLPLFRQYACLSSILQALVANPVIMDKPDQSTDLVYKPGQKIKINKVQRRSNVKYAVAKQEIIKDADDCLKIDITLSFIEGISTAKPKLEVYAPVRGHGKASTKPGWFCYAAFEIEEHGRLKMLAAQIPGVDSEKARQAASRILAVSEDIGVLLEWMLSQAR